MQVCMDSPDWLQGVINDEAAGGMDSAISSPSGDNMLACAASRPMMERRLRPQHDQALKCPRCDSTNTKFCYYNNYSLSQPRYFCKTCRRYWTKGGTLRNIPVGGGCRKNKKVAAGAKKPSSSDHPMISQNNLIISGGSSSSPSPSISGPTDLHLFPEVQLSHLYGSLGGSISPATAGDFLQSKFPARQIDFLESKFEQAAALGDDSSSRGGHDLMGQLGLGNMGFGPSNFNGLVMGSSQFGIPDGASPSGAHMDTRQRLMLPAHDYQGYDEDCGSAIDVKPINSRLLSLDWQQEQGCSDAGKDYGYSFGCVGPWSGMLNTFGPSTTNPLV